MPFVTQVDGIQYDVDPSTNVHNPGVASGRKLKMLGQTGNTVATQVANQQIGVIAAPALAAAATGTTTITNSLITTSSILFGSIRRGTTTGAAGAGVVFEFQAPANGSCVVSFRNPGSAASLSTDYQLAYIVIN